MKKEILKGYNSSLYYNGVVVHVLRLIRSNINSLRRSRKTDEYVIGAIYSLSVLLKDSDDCDYPIAKTEVNEWISIVEKWMKRIQKKISEEHFQELKNCLDVISAYAIENYQEHFWRNDSLKRSIHLSIKNEELLEKYKQAVEENHPVDLGNPLNKYLEVCLNKLLEEYVPTEQSTEKSKENSTNIYAAKFIKNEKDYSLILSDFDFFAKDNTSVTAYDLEDLVKKELKNKNDQVLLSLFFDCESSMFSVHSKNMDDLHFVNQVLLNAHQCIVGVEQ